MFAQVQLGILERGCKLTETETELISGRDVALVEVSVVDVEAFGIAVVAACDLGSVVAFALANCVCKLTAWAGRAVEDIDEAIAAFLARQTSPDDADDVRGGEDAFKDDWTGAVSYNDDLLVDFCDGSDKLVAVVPRVQVVSIAGYAFDLDIAFAGVGVDEHKSDIGRLRG